MRDSVHASRESWAKELRKISDEDEKGVDPAFYGPFTLLSSDQGIRGLLYVANDLCYLQSKDLKLEAWESDEKAGAADEEAVRGALSSLKKQAVAHFLKRISESLARYDWRASSAPDLGEDERVRKAAFRGSGGYRELRQDLLKQLARDSGDVGKSAKQALSNLGYAR